MKRIASFLPADTAPSLLPCTTRDNVMVAASADYLVTRNTTDFKSSSIPAVTPSELLAILQSEINEQEGPPPQKG